MLQDVDRLRQVGSRRLAAGRRKESIGQRRGRSNRRLTAAGRAGTSLPDDSLADDNDNEGGHEDERRKAGESDPRSNTRPGRPPGHESAAVGIGQELHRQFDPGHLPANGLQDLVVRRRKPLRFVLSHRHISGLRRRVAHARATRERTEDVEIPRISPIWGSSRSRW